LSLYVSHHERMSLPCSSTTCRRVSEFHLFLASRGLLTRFYHAICFLWELRYRNLLYHQRRKKKNCLIFKNLIDTLFTLSPFVSRSPLMSNKCKTDMIINFMGKTKGNSIRMYYNTYHRFASDCSPFEHYSLTSCFPLKTHNFLPGHA
jgi:hypothetical protein